MVPGEKSDSGGKVVDVTDDFSPRPDARRLHGIDEETPEAAALQNVQGVDGGAPWRAHVVLELARVLLRVQQHLGGSLRKSRKQSNGLKTKRGDQGGKLILILHSHEMLRQHRGSKQQRCFSHHYCQIGAKHAQHFGSCRLLNPVADRRKSLSKLV